MRKQEKYDKENMSTISTKQKNELVEEFKLACWKLDKPQSRILKEAMEKAIEEAENIKIKYGVEVGYYKHLDENDKVQDLNPCDLWLYDTQEEGLQAFNKEACPTRNGYVILHLMRIIGELEDEDVLRLSDYDLVQSYEEICEKHEE